MPPQEPAPPPTRRQELARILRFGVVGGGATLAYLVVALIAGRYAGFTPIQAAIAAQAVSTGVSYLGHLLFTFRVEAKHERYLPRFLLGSAITLVLNLTVTFVVTSVLGLAQQVAAVSVAVLIPFTNYLLGRYWVFKPK